MSAVNKLSCNKQNITEHKVYFRLKPPRFIIHIQLYNYTNKKKQLHIAYIKCNVQLSNNIKSNFTRFISLA